LAVFQVSHPYNNTDLTFVLNVRILTPFDIMLHIVWTQISCVVLVAVLVLSQRCTVFLMSFAV
jgi:hypothetical protein